MMRTLRRGAVLALLAGTLGCSATSVPIHGSDGKPYVYVDCSGTFQGLDDCYRLANQTCPAGYRLANSVAPRANPFSNLVIDCLPAGGTATASGTPAAGAN